jgi:hypothetical protein
MSDVNTSVFALLIGVSEQQNADTIPELPATATDVNKLAQVLMDPNKGGLSEDNVSVLVGQGATRNNIRTKLAELQMKTEDNPNSTAIVYFSGHGYWEETLEKYYFVPFDFDEENLAKTSLEDTFFAQKIDQLGAKNTLVLLDCCYAGQSGAIGHFKPQAAKIAPFLPEAGQIAKGVVDDEEQEDNSTSSKPIVGDTPPVEGHARFVFSSSSASEVSLVDDDAGISFFTRSLVEALEGHGMPRDAKEVGVFDVMKYLSNNVRRATDGQQNPRFDMNNGWNFKIAKLMGGNGIEGLDRAEEVDFDEVLKDLRLSISIHKESIIGGIKNEGISTGGGDFHGGNVNNVKGDQKNVEGDEVHGDKVGRDKIGGDQITVGNISGGTSQIGGRNNTQTVTHGITDATLRQFFEQQVYSKIEQWPENHPDIDREELKDTAEKIEKEIQKEEPNEGKLKRWIGVLKDNAPDILETVATIITNPPSGVAMALKKVAGLFKKS